MWFITGAIKYVLENMYFRYIKKKKIIGAKKIFFFLKMTYFDAFKSAGIGLLNYIHLRPIPALSKALV